MHHLKSLAFLCVVVTLCVACSNADTNDTNDPIIGDYFPNTVDNTWTYTVSNSSDTHPELAFQDATDFLRVQSVNGNSFTLNVNNGAPAYGTMNGMLASGTLTKDEATLLYSGAFQLPEALSGLIDQTIAVDGVLLYDLNASNASTISELTGSNEATLDLNGSPVPLFLNYTITSQHLNYQNTMTVNGVAYTNVVNTQLMLSISMYTTLPILGNITIIGDQNVMVIDNYFAEAVGLIASETTQNYQVNQAFLTLLASLNPSVDLGLDGAYHLHNVQMLNDYLVN